ncbi:HD-GYP domain-containing protein [Cellvibrio sp.]|uniref:HD-GYP domain-containing protein n=1 Tax=Cellvibrio sp. TaxID=1965322 RepID=UPI0039647D84
MSDHSNKNLVKLHISQLKLGMYVSELDISWLETHFEVQGILISSQKDIDAIANYAVFVWVDPLKAAPLVKQSLLGIEPKGVAAPIKQRTRSEQKAIKPRTSYANLKPAAQEHQIARNLYDQGKTAIKNILIKVAGNDEVAIEDARAVVNGCMESVIRNPDALMWMSKIREQDEYTAEHCLNVCILAMVFGRHLGLSETEIVRLGLCGLLHDVGKMKMPSEILNKPAKLSVEEFNIIKAHTLSGYNLLKNSAQLIPPVVAETAKSHHEQMDGSGYPAGIMAGNLDAMVRMISLVDAYDAMTSNRCYSKGKSNTEALKLIYEQKGKQFDEELALEFIRCIGIYPAGTLVQLLNGAVGVVIEINQKYRHLPKVLIVRDAEGNKVAPHILNLIEIESGELSSEHLVRCTLQTGSFGIDVSKYIVSSSS